MRLRPSPGDRGPACGRPGVSGPRRLVRSLLLRVSDDPGQCGPSDAGTLGKVNDLVTASGHEILEKKLDATLVGRCDSFVVETDVHYPTDVNLLRDSALRLIREALRACGAFGVDGRRKRQYWDGTVGELFNAVRTSPSQRSRPDAPRDQKKPNAGKQPAPAAILPKF